MVISRLPPLSIALNGEASLDFPRLVEQDRVCVARGMMNGIQGRLTRFTTSSVHLNAPMILLAEEDPDRLLDAFLNALSSGKRVFLGNPHWGETEWQQVLNLIPGDRISGNYKSRKSEAIVGSVPAQIPKEATIMIPTGGSSGQIRFAMHNWETLSASVRGFQEYFQTETVNSLCTLPLYHVSGLMQFMRSHLSGGKLSIIPFSQLKAGRIPAIDSQDCFISLVPTQLQALLEYPQTIDWLRRCRAILLGGAPAWDDLLDRAQSYHLPVAPCYGMTETASQIATLKPERFLAGDRSNGRVLPHANVQILSSQGTPLPPMQTGTIAIAASSLALGYYPNRFPEAEALLADDVGYFDEAGNLNIIGRTSNKIVTGGENVYPAEVEAAIRSTNLVLDVAVVGIEDSYWGSAIAAVYVPRNSQISALQIQTALAGKIARYKQPKHWIEAIALPRNSRGKIEQTKLMQLIRAATEVGRAK